MALQAETAVMVTMDFERNAEKMGLTKLSDGVFMYSDKFGKVLYRSLQTQKDIHVMNQTKVPVLALFTAAPGESSQFIFRGILSQAYYFIGNESSVNKVLSAIQELSSVVLSEKQIVSPDYTQLYYEVTIKNAESIPSIGDVYPQVTIRNSYNGTLQQTISYGLTLNDVSFGRLSCNFRQTLGMLSQKHHEHSKSISVEIGKYIKIFKENINDIFAENSNRILTSDDVLKTLDVISEVGLRRRNAVAKLLQNFDEADENEQNQISAWNVFLAILKYTSREQNINAKVALENIAERVLILPTKMMTALKIE